MRGQSDANPVEPCVFCEIVARRAPARIVESGNDHVAFAPLGEIAPSHVLFVSRKHLVDATDSPVGTGAVFAAAAAYVRRLGIEANLIAYVGGASQSVRHLHVHVVPRSGTDTLPAAWPWVGLARRVH